jgi:hypothetical protein
MSLSRNIKQRISLAMKLAQRKQAFVGFVTKNEKKYSLFIKYKERESYVMRKGKVFVRY